MRSIRVKALPALSGELFVPGDKSITHRAVMLGSLGEGTTVVSGFLTSEDCLRTMAAFLAMGVEIDVDRPEGRLRITGRGLHGLAEPAHVLDLGNSGTSIRLLTGILAAQSFFSVMTGDASLRSRPMRRVVEPLRQMGGKIFGRSGGNLAPLAVVGGALAGITYDLPVSSAQVKSALLLAGLYAKGETVLREPHPSRDHTERLFRHFGIPLRSEEGSLRLRSIDGFAAREVAVPGDFSSAAFFIVAATLIPGSDVRIRGVGVNPTRTGFLDVLREMGGRIDVENPREEAGEPVADLRVRAAGLKGTRVGGGTIPRLIDEVPILCVAMASADGESVIQDAGELRVKESDRIAAMGDALLEMGASVEILPDGMKISGGRLRGGRCKSLGDHRVAMSMIVAGMLAEGETIVEDIDCIDTSFPGFVKQLRNFSGKEAYRIEKE